MEAAFGAAEKELSFSAAPLVSANLPKLVGACDSQASIGSVSSLLEKKESEDGQAPKLGYFQDTGRGREA